MDDKAKGLAGEIIGNSSKNREIYPPMKKAVYSLNITFMCDLFVSFVS
jgi:hypothetical protein